MKIIALVIGCTVFTASASEIATRDMYCDDTKVIATALKDKYKEMPVISGVAEDDAGSLMTIWMNPISESWTIVATKNDFSCIIGVGNKFKIINYKKDRV